MENTAGELIEESKAVARDVAEHPWVQRLTRLGLVVQGVVYASTGLLVIGIALGVGRARADQAGVIALIAAQPFGLALLLVMAIGLATYMSWNALQFVLNKNCVPAKQWWGYLGTAAACGLLLYSIVRALAGLPMPPEEPPREVHGLLSTPWGALLVGLAGLIVLGLGAWQLTVAWRGNFEKDFERYALSTSQVQWACRLGRCGTAARALVFLLVGAFLLQAALELDPNEIRGLDAALRRLATEPFGPGVLAVVALGLIAYGAYSLAGAVWFRLKTPDQSSV